MKVIVVGNSLACLMATGEIARAGNDVTIVNPEPTWSSFFQGYRFQGQQFDNGNTLFDLTAIGPQESNPDSYDPDICDDVDRFSAFLTDFLSQFRIPLSDVPPLESFVAGVRGPDILLSDQLGLLKRMEPSACESIEAELREIAAHPKSSLLPSNENRHAHTSINLEEASRLNHGETLHRNIVEDFCLKQFNCSSAELSAAYHKSAGIPLYSRDAIESQLNNRPDRSTVYRVWCCPSVGNTRVLLNTLIAQANRSNVTPINSKIRFIDSSSIELIDGTRVEGDRVIWGLPNEMLLETLGELKQSATFTRPTVVAHFIIATGDIGVNASVLSISDHRIAPFRIFNQTYSARRSDPIQLITAECCYHWMEKTWPDVGTWPAILEESLRQTGILKRGASPKHMTVRRIENSQFVPTLSHLARFEENRQTVLRLVPKIELLGLPASPRCSSMKDQILHGLQVGRALRSEQ